jgi:hypothetical protein
VKALPGEPADHLGEAIPYTHGATTQVKGNRRPRYGDLAAHDHGAVPPEEEALREEVRTLMRRYVAQGMRPARAKVAIVVAAVVELMAIRSEVAAARTRSRLERKAAS